MQSFDKLKAVLSTIEEDIIKCEQKGQKAAGTRIRKAMQDVKNIAHGIRKEVLTLTKSGEDAILSSDTKPKA